MVRPSDPNRTAENWIASRSGRTEFSVPPAGLSTTNSEWVPLPRAPPLPRPCVQYPTLRPSRDQMTARFDPSQRSARALDGPGATATATHCIHRGGRSGTPSGRHARPRPPARRAITAGDWLAFASDPPRGARGRTTSESRRSGSRRRGAGRPPTALGHDPARRSSSSAARAHQSTKTSARRPRPARDSEDGRMLLRNTSTLAPRAQTNRPSVTPLLLSHSRAWAENVHTARAPHRAGTSRTTIPPHDVCPKSRCVARPDAKRS